MLSRRNCSLPKEKNIQCHNICCLCMLNQVFQIMGEQSKYEEVNKRKEKLTAI